MTTGTSSSIYEIDCTDYSGKSLPLRLFAGRPLLIVNTASLCGFSSQFPELEQVWQHHKNNGLMVLGVPSNDFGHQEPGNNPEIVALCTTKFGISFPLLGKISVRGSQAHPLFQWLRKEGGFLAKPRWNFYKYIVGRDGHLQDWFSSLTKPSDPRFQLSVTHAVETQTNA